MMFRFLFLIGLSLNGPNAGAETSLLRQNVEQDLMFLESLSSSASARRICSVAPPQSRMDPVLERAWEVERFLQDLADCNRFSGAIRFRYQGKLLLDRNFGLADRGRARPVDPSTLFSLDSVSKHITAVAILKLEEEGKLSLDDPISRFIPGLAKDRAGITLRQLLSHTSGLTQEWDEKKFDPYEFEGELKIKDPARFFSGYLSAAPLESGKPSFQYNNMTYSFLAWVVEKSSGETYEDFTRALFRKAGLSSAQFNWEPVSPPYSAAHGLHRDEEGKLLDVPSVGDPHDYYKDWGSKGSGGIAMTADDLMRWTEALRSEKLISRPQLEKLFTPSDPHAETSYALGVTITPGSPGKPEAVYHGGSKRGSSSDWWFSEKQNSALVILQNRSAENPGIKAEDSLPAILREYLVSGHLPPEAMNASHKPDPGFFCR